MMNSKTPLLYKKLGLVSRFMATSWFWSCRVEKFIQNLEEQELSMRGNFRTQSISGELQVGVSHQLSI